MVLISWNVLNATHKVSEVNGMPYYQVMIDVGVFTWEQWQQAAQDVEFCPYDHPMHDDVATGTFYCYQSGDGFVFDEQWRPRLTLRADNTFEVYSNMGEGFYYGEGTWYTVKPENGRVMLYLFVEPGDRWYGRTYFALEVLDAGGTQLRLAVGDLHLAYVTSCFVHGIYG